ncbi:hypothetical protein [Segeticoccus rhizosphaerae]|uniref:hypothetical protein n=1 Tax=Segeticoccus rhizosphaerae TaxID=1104777 RepID=UPI0010C10EAD|nr:hypothetical protein [Ornithinicoccus soli]
MPDGSVLFGEYLDNAERGRIHVFRLPAGESKIEIAHSFAEGDIRHIHSVNWDPYAARVVIATGDVGDECKLLSFSADFTECAAVGEGGEDWRMISPQFTSDSIYFGTDAQYQVNAIKRYDRRSGMSISLAKVNGPVFYSAPCRQGWLFATAAEMCVSQTTPEAILYYVDPADDTVTPIANFAKDYLSTKYFQFGLLSLPIITRPQEVIPISGTALKGIDGKFFAVT